MTFDQLLMVLWTKHIEIVWNIMLVICNCLNGCTEQTVYIDGVLDSRTDAACRPTPASWLQRLMLMKWTVLPFICRNCRSAADLCLWTSCSWHWQHRMWLDVYVIRTELLIMVDDETRTPTRSCRIRKTLDPVHVYSPGVAATRHVWPAATAPAATALLLLQLMALL